MDNNYTKPALSFNQQAQRLISRGLIVHDPGELESYLSVVNYYRLSGYWYIYKQIDLITGEENLSRALHLIPFAIIMSLTANYACF